MKRKITKRRYLLIEIMLSIGLVSICLLPLIQPLFLQLKKEKELVHKFQFEMVAKNSFLEVKKGIHDQNKNTRINSEQELKGALCAINITGESGDLFVERSYTISVLKSYNKSSSKAMYYLCDVEIFLKAHNTTKRYSYTTFIEELKEAL